MDSHFACLKDAFITALDTRLASLKSDIENIRTDALKPLDACKSLVDGSLKTAAQVMEEGNNNIIIFL